MAYKDPQDLQKWQLQNAEKVKIYKAKYRDKNRETIKAKARAWRVLHLDEARAKVRAANARNPAMIKASGERYRQRYPDRIRESRHASYTRHRAKQLASHAEYCKTHSEQIRQSRAAYRLRNKQQILVANNARRARKHQAPCNDFTHAQWLEMQEAFDHCCAYCGKRSKGHLTQDHITPLIAGGSHTLANIVPACARCNSKKGIRANPIPVQPLLLTLA